MLAHTIFILVLVIVHRQMLVYAALPKSHAPPNVAPITCYNAEVQRGSSARGGFGMRGCLPVRRTSGRVLIVVGAALTLLALFSPWLRLYTTFGDTTAGEHSYSPWTLLSAGGWDAILSVAVGFCFPVVALAASSVAAFLGDRERRRLRTLLTTLTLELAISGLIASLFVVAVLPTGLALAWPYFTLRAVEYGAWAAIAGFACVTLGVIILHAER
jgi:hypothetical protein